jgi:hypothetical protein
VNKFDRILWRINGLLFLALLAFGVVQLASVLIATRVHHSLIAEDTALFPSATRAAENEVFRLGWPSRIPGTSIVRMPLYGEVPSTGSSFKASGSHQWTRNYLFMDYSDLSSWWLFEGFKQRITKDHDMREEIETDKKRVISTIFEVVRSNGSDDHSLSAEHPVAALFTGADGKKPIEIVSPSDRIISIDQVPNNQVLIVYQRGSVVTAALFSTQTGEQVKESTLTPKEK